MIDRNFVKFLKEQYPKGTRIRLNSMSDPYAPVEPGTEGSVEMVDDAGQLLMKWDNGRTLALIPGEDSFSVLPPKLTTLKLYMPMTVDRFESDGWGGTENEPTELSNYEAIRYAAFHQKPQQMHIHMIIFSTDPKEGYLTKDGIRQVKSAFARRIYQADRMHVYRQKNQSRDALQWEARRAMAECIVQLKRGTIRNPKLEKLITELADRLQETRGRKVYGYLPPRTKAIVDAIVEELAKDQQVSAAYEVWQKLYEQICLDYNEQLPKRLPLSQQKEFKTVRNMVIQETLQWMAERQRYAEAMGRKPAAPDTPERSVPTENTPSAFPEPENPGAPPVPENAGESADASRPDSIDLPPSEGEQPIYEPPQSDVQSRTAGPTYYGPTVGEAVVRMLHHMSRIFEDNSRTDRIHRGLQIDHKRRQELQRKRLAMGHKADDHEEISLK